MPEWSELMSFKQCINILFAHPISIATHRGIDISFYINLLEKTEIDLRVEYFDERYFKNIPGYNKLMLSSKFYNRFKNFEYILIYQLDAWVFRDELNMWCQRGYDYVGAPWFENFGSHEDGNKIWTTGNGGFSLRRVPSLLKVLNNKRPLLKISKLKVTYPPEKTLFRRIRRIFVICIRSIGVKNNINYNVRKSSNNEDWFWTLFSQDLGIALNKPGWEESINFSFEKSPKFLYELNGRKLPFGCHAWEKYEYDTFWKYFIIMEN